MFCPLTCLSETLKKSCDPQAGSRFQAFNWNPESQWDFTIQWRHSGADRKLGHSGEIKPPLDSHHSSSRVTPPHVYIFGGVHGNTRGLK